MYKLPQHNVLFKPLTVREHLQLFCRLKGVPADLIENEVNECVEQIDLKLKENEVEKYKIEISENEVFLNLNSIANKNLENLKTKFKNNNIDFEVYKNNLKTELSWRKLIFFLYNKKIELNESEIDLELKKILKDNKNNFEFELNYSIIF